MHLYSAFPCNMHQFTPSGPEAYIGASGSRFKAVHACWYSFYRPRKDGKLSELSGKEGHPNIQPSTRPGIELGTSGLGGRDRDREVKGGGGGGSRCPPNIFKIIKSVFIKKKCIVPPQYSVMPPPPPSPQISKLLRGPWEILTTAPTCL